MGKTLVDIIIPSYNGLILLQKNLPYIFKYTPNLRKVIIIDNGSSDNTAAWLQKKYPQVQVIINDTNLGFTGPINQGVAVSTAKYFVLLNNDVQPLAKYINFALDHFKTSQNVFAVTFNEKQSSWPLLRHANGKIQFTLGEDKTMPHFSAWASGGSAIFSRKIWDKLGGLDEIYSPWYWEDIDIGYRAWKSGYKIIWEPKALINHHHESTSKKLNKNYVNRIKQRNELLFNWLNIQDRQYRYKHFVFLLTHTLTHPGYIIVFLSALFRYLTHRHLPRSFKYSDQAVIQHILKTV